MAPKPDYSQNIVPEQPAAVEPERTEVSPDPQPVPDAPAKPVHDPNTITVEHNDEDPNSPTYKGGTEPEQV